MLTSTVSENRDDGEALADAVRATSSAGRPLRIVGGGTKSFYGRTTDGDVLDLSGHRGVVDYEPSELVITARAGTPIQAIEALLAENGQRLAFEPPVLGAASTFGGVIAAGLAGPRRPFAGAVRDSVLGVRVLNGAGQSLRLGGTVFKNVAGFDGFRLMAGALGCLGVLLEVSVRVSPIPAAERTLSLDMGWAAARSRLTDLMRRPTPLDGAAHDGERLHLRLAGPEGVVSATAAELGGDSTPASFWPGLRHHTLPLLTSPRLWRLAVPRTCDLPELPGVWLRDWAGGEIWLVSEATSKQVRALAGGVGGHATLYRGARTGEEVFAPLPAPLLALHQRLKAVFDPAGIFNPGRMYAGL